MASKVLLWKITTSSQIATRTLELFSRTAPTSSGRNPGGWMSRSVPTEIELNQDTAGERTDLDWVLIRRNDGVRSGVVVPIGPSRTFKGEEYLPKMAIRAAIKWRLIAVVTKQAIK